MNGRADGNFYSDLDNLPWNCIANTSSFPSHDLLESPSQNSSAITFNEVSENTVNLSWVNGNGTHRVLVVKEESPVDEFPKDGLNYLANTEFGLGADLGNGNFIVISDTSNQVTVSNLNPNTNYYFNRYVTKLTRND